MEWIDGVKITHTNELRGLGYDISDILHETIEAFAE